MRKYFFASFDGFKIGSDLVHFVRFVQNHLVEDGVIRHMCPPPVDKEDTLASGLDWSK